MTVRCQHQQQCINDVCSLSAVHRTAVTSITVEQPRLATVYNLMQQCRNNHDFDCSDQCISLAVIFVSLKTSSTLISTLPNASPHSQSKYGTSLHRDGQSTSPNLLTEGREGQAGEEVLCGSSSTPCLKKRPTVDLQ